MVIHMYRKKWYTRYFLCTNQSGSVLVSVLIIIFSTISCALIIYVHNSRIACMQMTQHQAIQRLSYKKILNQLVDIALKSPYKRYSVILRSLKVYMTVDDQTCTFYSIETRKVLYKSTRN